MFKGHYYILLALPPLSLKEKPELTFPELLDVLTLNLSEKEMDRVNTLFEQVDLYNIKAFWLGEPLDVRGNIPVKNLEEALLLKDAIPPYVSDYLEKYEGTNELISHYAEVIASFYKEKEEHETGFLKEWFTFERKVLLFLTALRSKELGRNLSKELQFEDSSDPTVSFLLAQKDANEIFLPSEFEKLKMVFVENRRDPEKLNYALLQYRFEKVEELSEQITPFSLDQVLAYVVKFLIVQSWFEQGDWEQGRTLVDELSKYG